MAMNQMIRDLITHTINVNDLKCDGKALTLGKQHSDSISPESYFSGLGFDATHAMDVSDFEGADIIHDLNLPVPSSLHETFGLIYDGGTLEHVFDVRQGLFNVLNMTSAGGIIVHCNPCNNAVNHGFFQFSPTLFTSFYIKNNFKILALFVFGARKGDPDRLIGRFVGDEVKSAHLACRLVIRAANAPDYICNLVTIVRRPRGALTAPLVPTQGFYDGSELDRDRRRILLI